MTKDKGPHVNVRRRNYKRQHGEHVPTLEADRSVRGERALWRAVIVQAMMDASSASAKPEAINARTEAYHWLTSNSADFRTVCDYAGLEPSYVRRVAKRALLKHCAWRLEPGQGKRYRLARVTKPKPPAEEPPSTILPFRPASFH